MPKTLDCELGKHDATTTTSSRDEDMRVAANSFKYMLSAWILSVISAVLSIALGFIAHYIWCFSPFFHVILTVPALAFQLMGMEAIVVYLHFSGKWAYHIKFPCTKYVVTGVPCILYFYTDIILIYRMIMWGAFIRKNCPSSIEALFCSLFLLLTTILGVCCIIGCYRLQFARELGYVESLLASMMSCMPRKKIRQMLQDVLITLFQEPESRQETWKRFDKLCLAGFNSGLRCNWQKNLPSYAILSYNWSFFNKYFPDRDCEWEFLVTETKHGLQKLIGCDRSEEVCFCRRYLEDPGRLQAPFCGN